VTLNRRGLCHVPSLHFLSSSASDVTGTRSVTFMSRVTSFTPIRVCSFWLFSGAHSPNHCTTPSTLSISLQYYMPCTFIPNSPPPSLSPAVVRVRHTACSPRNRQEGYRTIGINSRRPNVVRFSQAWESCLKYPSCSSYRQQLLPRLVTSCS
jgi:hypothetical protein